MTDNLPLTGTNNSIVVHSQAALYLSQQITTAGTQNTRGGIAPIPFHVPNNLSASAKTLAGVTSPATTSTALSGRYHV